MNDLEYANRYNGIHFMLHRAYLDYYYLETLVHYTNENLQDVSRKAVCSIKHFCELLKMSICLSLWKACFDSDGKANSLPQLNRYLRDHYNTNANFHFSKAVLLSKKSVETLRNQTFAHYDYEYKSVSVRLDEFRKILDEAQKYLCKLYHPEIDEKVKPLNDNEILDIRLESIYGFGTVLEHGIFKSEEKGEV